MFVRRPDTQTSWQQRKGDSGEWSEYVSGVCGALPNLRLLVVVVVVLVALPNIWGRNGNL